MTDFQLTPPDVELGEEPRFVEQGIRVYKVSDYEWYAGADRQSVIEACLAEWGGSAEEYFDEGEDAVTPVDLDANTIILSEEGDPDGPKATFREYLKQMISEKAPFPCFFAGLDY